MASSIHEDILNIIETTACTRLRGDESDTLNRADLIDDLEKLESKAKDAENKLHVFNKRLLDHFKRKKVNIFCLFASKQTKR